MRFRLEIAILLIATTGAQADRGTFYCLSDGLSMELGPKTASYSPSRPKPNPFTLPAGQSRNYIGVIVETDKGRYLAVGNYDWTSHENLLYSIEKNTGLKPTAKPLKILWAGEFNLANTESQSGIGRITEINETSSSFFKRSTPEERFESASKAKQVLSESIPQVITPQTQPIHYDPAREHLNPLLNTLKIDVRHDMGTKLSATVMNLELYLELGEEGLSIPEVLENWRYTFSSIEYMEKIGVFKSRSSERQMAHEFSQITSWKDIRNLGRPRLEEMLGYLNRVNNTRKALINQHQAEISVYSLPR